MPVDYSGQDLRGRDFSRQDLKWANLEDANLSGADLTDADLTGAFRRPGINRADLAGVKGLDSIIGLVELGTPEVEGSVTVRTPLTGTHESPGYRDGPGVASDRLLWHRRHPVGAAVATSDNREGEHPWIQEGWHVLSVPESATTRRPAGRPRVIHQPTSSPGIR